MFITKAYLQPLLSYLAFAKFNLQQVVENCLCTLSLLLCCVCVLLIALCELSPKSTDTSIYRTEYRQPNYSTFLPLSSLLPLLNWKGILKLHWHFTCSAKFLRITSHPEDIPAPTKMPPVTWKSLPSNGACPTFSFLKLEWEEMEHLNW